MGTLSIKSAARAVLLAGAALCLPVATATATATATELKVGLASEPTSVDPHFHHLIPNDQVTAHIFEALVAVGPDFSLRPGLATSWKATSDTSWEFKLREGVKFHDGTPFDAAAVKYNIERIRDDKISSLRAGEIRALDTVEAVDKSTVRFTLKYPFAAFAFPLTDVAGAIGSPTATRAVAGACAANPVAVAIPCHRVVRNDGGLSGYRWGVDRKRVLLEREAAAA